MAEDMEGAGSRPGTGGNDFATNIPLVEPSNDFRYKWLDLIQSFTAFSVAVQYSFDHQMMRKE